MKLRHQLNAHYLNMTSPLFHAQTINLDNSLRICDKFSSWMVCFSLKQSFTTVHFCRIRHTLITNSANKFPATSSDTKRYFGIITMENLPGNPIFPT